MAVSEFRYFQLVVNCILFILVGIATQIGQAVGGTFGGWVGGVVAFAAGLLMIDSLKTNVSIRGSLIQHRKTLLECAVAMGGVMIGTLLLGPFLGSLVGFGVALSSIEWLCNGLGWENVDQPDDMKQRLAYVGILNHIATSGSSDTPGDRQLRLVAERIFGDAVTEAELVRLIRRSENEFGSVDATHFVSCLSPEWQSQLVWDVLRITYERLPPTCATLQAARSVIAVCHAADPAITNYYDRQSTIQPEQVRQWLSELGLASEWSLKELESAYRRAAKQYHPDRVVNQPNHIVSLAQEKMIRLNNAYEGLKRCGAPSGQYRYRAPDNRELLLDSRGCDISLRCWLCHELTRVSARSNRSVARCRYCCALLGV